MAKEDIKSTQFFERLMSYGGISTDPGIIYMWGDPDVLIPTEAFTILQEKLIEKLGEEGENLIIWAGRMNGYQASVVLEKKFGIPFTKIWNDNHEDMDNLINGATQDGYGFIKAVSYPEKGKSPIKFTLGGTNCNIGKKTLELFGKKSKGMDFFELGIIFGGSDFLFKKNFSLKESKCIAKGDEECIFDIYEGDDQYKIISTLFKKVNIDQKNLEKKMESLYLKRPSKGGFVNAKKIQFGNGNFVFLGLTGVVFASRIMVPFFEYLKKRLSSKDYEELLNEFSKGYLEELFRGLSENKAKTTKDILKLIERLNLLGLGEFKLASSSNKLLFIENKTNTLAQDRKFLLGTSKIPTDDFIAILLKNVLEKFYNSSVNVIESECIAQGKMRCLFKITIS